VLTDAEETREDPRRASTMLRHAPLSSIARATTRAPMPVCTSLPAEEAADADEVRKVNWMKSSMTTTLQSAFVSTNPPPQTPQKKSQKTKSSGGGGQGEGGKGEDVLRSPNSRHVWREGTRTRFRRYGLFVSSIWA
jgi:hypothetical protein